MNLLAKIIVPIFGRIAARRGEKMREKLAKDPEVIKLQNDIHESYDRLQVIMQKMRDEQSELKNRKKNK
jgi:hypothetical protein